MEIQTRLFRDSTDLARMKQLLMDGSQARINGSCMHPGCLDWDTQYPPDEETNRRNLHLWERTDQEQSTLAAWAILLRREGSFDLFISSVLYGTPLYETVMAEELHRMKIVGLERTIVGFDPNNRATLGFGASAYFTIDQKEL